MRAKIKALFSRYISSNLRVITSGNVTVSSTDTIIVVRKTVSSTTHVVLPSFYSTTQPLIIKDGKGDASTHNITITAANGALIDNQPSFVMNLNYMAISLVFDGSHWNLV